MFLDIDEFARQLLSITPSAALVTWENDATLKSFVRRIGPALRAQTSGTVVARIDGVSLDSESFSRSLLSALTKKSASNTCLLIYQIEPLAAAAGKVLNGFRERLSSMQAVVIAIRGDRIRDLIIQCPDLMDWIGLTVARAEDLERPFTIRDVRKSIKQLEQRNNISTAAFLKKWEAGTSQDIDDGWLWKELIAVKRELEGHGSQRIGISHRNGTSNCSMRGWANADRLREKIVSYQRSQIQMEPFGCFVVVCFPGTNSSRMTTRRSNRFNLYKAAGSSSI